MTASVPMARRPVTAPAVAAPTPVAAPAVAAPAVAASDVAAPVAQTAPAPPPPTDFDGCMAQLNTLKAQQRQEKRRLGRYVDRMQTAVVKHAKNAYSDTGSVVGQVKKSNPLGYWVVGVLVLCFLLRAVFRVNIVGIPTAVFGLAAAIGIVVILVKTFRKPKKTAAAAPT